LILHTYLCTTVIGMNFLDTIGYDWLQNEDLLISDFNIPQSVDG
jgi:hypothetical protein